MRVLFAGSPLIAVPSLEALVRLTRDEPGIGIAGVLTNPDSPRGRHGTSEPTDVGAAADRLSAELVAEGRTPLTQLKCEKLDAAAREAVTACKPDLLVSFAYGRIFGPQFLALFPLGGVNIHPSLLPTYRGATPIPQAILNRDTETGITIQKLAPEMDAGDILAQERFPLTGRETTGSLSDTAAQKAAALLTGLIREWGRGVPNGVIRGQPQNHAAASYCSLITKDEGRIDWTRSAADIDARIRAFTPWPLCLTRQGEQELYILAGRPAPVSSDTVTAPSGTVLGIDKQLGILIQTGDGVFAAERLQYRTKKALDWRAFLNGAHHFIGSRLE
jgi:methionyl-tRNA formyltransferase